MGRDFTRWGVFVEIYKVLKILDVNMNFYLNFSIFFFIFFHAK